MRTREYRRFQKRRANKRWLRRYREKNHKAGEWLAKLEQCPEDHRWYRIIASYYLDWYIAREGIAFHPPRWYRKWTWGMARTIYREEMRKDPDLMQFPKVVKVHSAWNWY